MPYPRWFSWTSRILLILVVGFVSTGCLRYDLGLQFDHADHGQLVQQIRVSPRAAALAAPALEGWLDNLSVRVRHLGGQVRHQGETTTLILPFEDSAELNNDFQQIFSAVEIPGLGRVRSHFSLAQTNRLLAVHNHLVYDLNLADLPDQADAPAQFSNDWLEVFFRLQVPWGFQVAPDSMQPEGDRWQLRPGQRYHLDVSFWLPSWIGLGSIAIALFVLLGYFLKYGLKAGSRRGG
ncbi:hypothetical protein C7271_24880 [filamentous cyanobacterium CCP5]|nr:hypothetical protein C7271_24880 [filamentous cyanobacterium CCP5]